ncbi:MAG: hypothetical protein AAF391_00325 [Bacteroidota bacterium]
MKKLVTVCITLLCMVIGLNGQTRYMDLLSNLQIRSIGPSNMSGRITAIDVVSPDKNVMYVGAASGGVWKSENGGTRWDPVFDANPTQNIGALAIQQDQPNIVWVGTGEGNPRNSMNLGMGIFKTIDGGQTWKHMGLEKTKTIHRVIVDPKDGEVVYVGAMGDPFTPGPDRGLYKTEDGGQSWRKILFTNQKSGIADLVMDPANPNKLLAAMYDHRRTPYSFISGGPGSGLYMTLDGGETWKQLTKENGLPEGNLGRIGLAIAPSNPDRIYAKIEAEKNALYRSDDGGYNWELVNDNPRYTNNRPFYFQELAVSSDDQNLLYNIYQPLSVSYDGGLNFDPVPQIPADETKGIHADFHAFWMSPDDAEFYIIGGDGGIGITRDRGESWYFPESIPVGQFYQVNVDEQLPYNVYGGLQDNGNWYGPGYVWRRGGIRTLYWQYLVGGDGFYIEPDQEDPRFGYGTSQNGDLYRYDKIGGYYSSVKPPTPEGIPRLRFHWNAAFAQDPHDPSRVYYGSQFIHVSDDRGKTWSIISPDLTTNIPSQQKRDYGGLTLDASGAEFYNCILALAPSPVDKEVIWAGTDDGKIQLTTDGGGNWKDVTRNIKGMPEGAWVARIHASKYEASSAWAVVNNYRKGDYRPYLFKTNDSGKSWKQIVSEDSPVYGYALSFIQDRVEPNLVFLGTENGLWVSFDEGANWESFGNGFPSVSTMDMKIQRRESALVVGTFGRSIWIIDDLRSLRKLARGVMKKNLEIASVNPVVQVKGIFINAPGNIWSGFHTTFEGDNRPFRSVQIPYFIKETVDDEVITAIVFNAEGTELIELVGEDIPVKGLNYLEWRLDEEINRLPNSWITEESRGIPVLPGNYKVVLKYSDATDSVNVEVVADPRYDFDPAIDRALYEAQKRLDAIREKLVTTLDKLDDQKSSIESLDSFLSGSGNESLQSDIQELMKGIDRTKSEALGSRTKKQVGAWQTFEVTPVKKIREAERKFMSSHTMPSVQEMKLLEDAEEMVDAFLEAYETYLSESWNPFVQKVEEAGIEWEP